MRHFCTYFDHRYLPQGLALYESLRRHCGDFCLWVLCLSDSCHRVLDKLALEKIRPIALSDLERGDDELLKAKGNRSIVEYYFTCSSSLPLHVFKLQPDVEMLTYLDSDLWFFSSPEPLFDELGGNSIGIVSHRFPASLHHMEKNGIYNVGWLTFRRDERGLACLRWWQERCLEWCYDRHEPGRFADQKYLDDWPERFPGVAVLQHTGANVAPWNLANHPVEENAGGVLVDGQALIFFHFHHLKRLRGWLFETALPQYQVKLNGVLKRRVFAPYLAALDAQRRRVQPLLSDDSSGNTIRQNWLDLDHEWPSVGERVRRSREFLKDLRSHRKLLYLAGRVC